MTKSEFNSPAFRKARLESEQRRLLGVILFALAFAVIVVVRILLMGSRMSRLSLLVLLLFAAYEFWVYRRVGRALARGADLPRPWRYGNTVLESAVAGFGVAFLANPQISPDYRALANPWVPLFFVLLLLSTLHLDPLVCRVAGVVSTISYLAAAYHHGWRFIAVLTSEAAVTQSWVCYYAAAILVTGFLAGAVSTEILKYMEAALREAETERQLQQVQHDLQIARSIQRSLLPRVRPQIPGFEIAGWNCSADDTGGDFFDWKSLEDGRIVVTLADVTGHGIGPALLAAICRAYSRASFNSRDPLPSILQRINESFGEDLSDGRFATFVAAVCNQERGEVELISAGQGPLLLFSAHDGEVREITAQAIPLGIMPKLNASASAVLKMSPGDMVLLITDGFFEWANPVEEQFGTERVAAVARRVRHLPPEEIIAELYQEVLKFSQGTPQQDDLTAVVIKRVAADVGQPATHSIAKADHDRPFLATEQSD